jgi:DNA invertase Pin-like site-specific DNA recombinase
MNDIIELLAEIETNFLRSARKKGQKRAKDAGKKWGGSKKGWKWKVTDDCVEKILKMKSDGESIAKISRTTKLSRPTIYRVLNNVEK